MHGRRARLLIEVVDRYIRTRQPVSSRELVVEYRHRFSPATTRAELLALEREGYLYKPYPSAGRVPTPKGFRFFADWLLELGELEAQGPQLPAEPQDWAVPEVPALFQRTALLLSTMSGGLGFVLAPARDRFRCRSILVRPLRPGTVLVVTVSEIGTVEPRLVEVGVELGPEEVATVEAFLGTWLGQHSLADAPPGAWAVSEGWHSRAALGALAILRGLARGEGERTLYMEGWPRLFSLLAVRSPDWALARVEGLLRLLEAERVFCDLLAALREGRTGLAVHVGDGSVPEVKELSVVSAPYLTEDDLLGVIGPLWMDYAHACSAARYVARRLGGILGRAGLAPEVNV